MTSGNHIRISPEARLRLAVWSLGAESGLVGDRILAACWRLVGGLLAIVAALPRLRCGCTSSEANLAPLLHLVLFAYFAIGEAMPGNMEPWGESRAHTSPGPLGVEVAFSGQHCVLHIRARRC